MFFCVLALVCFFATLLYLFFSCVLLVDVFLFFYSFSVFIGCARLVCFLRVFIYGLLFSFRFPFSFFLSVFFCFPFLRFADLMFFCVLALVCFFCHSPLSFFL